MKQWQSEQKRYPVRLLAIENPKAARLLQYLLESCGYRVACDPAELPEADFLLVQPGCMPNRTEGLEYMLLENSGRMTESISCPFRYHAVEYETALPVLPGAQRVSYSVHSPEADVFARNIRQNGYGIVFELESGGIVGRVALDEEQGIRPALVAALAAIRCGIPFARVTDALNEIPQLSRNLG
ncbi:hypothetical protein HMPREF1141_1552 [Clostridium sp. MSTE9]|uniref:hypothetical protein n=1 Tax=Clostridium sp. (strain MSTE9) TaxID=1105031 RepID=UPI00026F35A9|nr:hypothetical protein [Clostridium sp. MSTE9]EJF40442.1 hypothetical protein HMPREF1141_1552 [Clostridium sp. MSTE9]